MTVRTTRRRCVVRRVVPVIVALFVLSPAATASAVSPSDDEPTPPGLQPATPTGERRPLVEVPRGCLVSPLPDVVFVGRVVDRDYRTARFRIGQVRAGDPAPFASDGLIDVRYGLDVQYLRDGERYLVAARRDPVLGILASRLRPEPPMFGGDDVVSLVESEVECPGFEDPAVTLHPDGRPVGTSLVGPLLEQRAQLAAALLLPLLIAFGVVFALATLRLSLAGMARGLGAAGSRIRARR